MTLAQPSATDGVAEPAMSDKESVDINSSTIIRLSGDAGKVAWDTFWKKHQPTPPDPTEQLRKRPRGRPAKQPAIVKVAKASETVLGKRVTASKSACLLDLV